MLRILKAHRFMQGKSLCTFITNFFYSLSRGLLSDDNYELRQCQTMLSTRNPKAIVNKGGKFLKKLKHTL